jgi:hypothetical protein
VVDNVVQSTAEDPFAFATKGWTFPHQLAKHLKLAKAGRRWVYIQATLRPGPGHGGAAGYAIWDAIAITDRSIVWANSLYADSNGAAHADLLGGMRSYPLATVKAYNFRTPVGRVEDADEENVPIDLYVGGEVVPIKIGIDYVPGATTVIRYGNVEAVLEAVVASWSGGSEGQR